MKKISLLAMLVAGMWATPVSAASSTYVSGSVGVGSLTNSNVNVLGVSIKDAFEYKTGVPFVGAVGLKNDSYRVEAAIGYQSHDVNKVLGIPYTAKLTVSALTFMANGYYDFETKGSALAPYLTVGLGAADVRSSDNVTTDSKTVFAWQAGAGLGLKATDNLTVDLGYRLLKPSNVSLGLGADLTLLSHNFLAGVRYSF